MTMRSFNQSNNEEVTGRGSPTNEVTVAQLAVLGGVLSTIGSIISTYASVLALEELQQTQNNNNNNNNDKISALEKQVKYLTKELHRQKKLRK